MLEVPSKVVDVIIDSDTYNEVDDQFAITYALRSQERINVVGIIAAPFLNAKVSSVEEGMNKSYEEIERVLQHLHQEELMKMVWKGSTSFLQDEHTPIKSEGVLTLIELAKNYSKKNPLYVIGLAALTDIASAILLDPSITERIVVVWLGGYAQHYKDADEFNLRQDVASVRVVFESDVPLIQVPCRGVVSDFKVSQPELEKWIAEKSEIGRYLTDIVIEEAERTKKGKPWTRVIWDVVAVAWLLNDHMRFMEERIIPRVSVSYDKQYIYPETDKIMKYIYYVERDNLMEDLFLKIGQQ